MLPITLPWVMYIAACLLELIIMNLRLSRNNRVIAGGILLMLLAMSQGGTLVSEPLIAGIPFFLVGIYRLLNCIRYIYGRMHEEYLYRVVPKSSWYIGLTQTVVGVSGLLLGSHHPSMRVGLYILAGIQLLVAVLLLTAFRVNLQKSDMSAPAPLPDKKLPSVSVLIPARNETADLEACLRTLTASTYQKLEILVLDDCSQDKTPEVIKKFAHDGVRFIQGSEPGEVWLPKNAAYNKLAHEASGEFLLFCGVDVRFDPEDIRTLVTYAIEHKYTMLSVLPRRSNEASPNSIVQQIRYLWELALPRTLAHRPPVLSTLWMIETTALKKYGGMAAVRRNVVPEGVFARELDKRGLYQFLRSGDLLQIQSTKPPREQRETALRVRYPQLHRRPEVVLLVSAIELFAVVGIYLLFIYAIITGLWFIVLATLLSAVLHLTIYISLSQVMGDTKRVRFLVHSAFSGLTDLWLMHRSMYLYEFDEVRWKERNVCLPVMHAIPSLPRLPKN